MESFWTRNTLLADISCQKVTTVSDRKTTPWIHEVHGRVCGGEQLGVPGQTAPSKKGGSTMGARSYRPGPYRTAVCPWGTTANCLDTGGSWLPIPHPVGVDNRLAGRNIQHNHLVFSAAPVLWRDLWDKENLATFPGPKPHRIIVSWRILLFKNVARNVLGHLSFNTIKKVFIGIKIYISSRNGCFYAK